MSASLEDSIFIPTYYTFELDRLVSENPRILYYVRILQIRFQYDGRPWRKLSDMKRLDEFANTLLMFPVL
jgi:hypothetical protein